MWPLTINPTVDNVNLWFSSTWFYFTLDFEYIGIFLGVFCNWAALDRRVRANCLFRVFCRLFIHVFFSFLSLIFSRFIFSPMFTIILLISIYLPCNCVRHVWPDVGLFHTLMIYSTCPCNGQGHSTCSSCARLLWYFTFHSSPVCFQSLFTLPV